METGESFCIRSSYDNDNDIHEKKEELEGTLILPPNPNLQESLKIEGLSHINSTTGSDASTNEPEHDENIDIKSGSLEFDSTNTASTTTSGDLYPNITAEDSLSSLPSSSAKETFSQHQEPSMSGEKLLMEIEDGPGSQDRTVSEKDVGVSTSYQGLHSDNQTISSTPIHGQPMRLPEGEAPYESSSESDISNTPAKKSRTQKKGYKCSNEKSNIDKPEINLQKRSGTTEKPFQCSVCSKAFKHKSQLAIHTTSHSGEKPYTCSVCYKSFGFPSQLNLHARSHTGEKPYECPICFKAFICRSHLTLHTKTHSEEKPYECSVCNNKYKSKAKLTIHMRSHTGEKPYECSICNKAFISQSHLTLHIRTHTGEKPYACSFCNKTFTCHSHLTVHTRIHTGEKPYECTFCGKAFNCQSRLVQHTRIHTGEKPYNCSVCSNAYGSLSQLKVHKRIHTAI